MIDNEINKLKALKTDFKFKCLNRIYNNPIDINETSYFRPLFKMSTHARIKEAGSDDTNAVDFDVPLGTNIYSAGDGIVSALQSDCTAGGNDPALAGKDNYLYIYSSKEKLIFCYRHLDPFNNIKLNDKIRKGDLLGRVGLTGYAVSPHLHFVIYEITENENYKLKSLKIEFV